MRYHQATTDPKALFHMLTHCALGARLGTEFLNLVIHGEESLLHVKVTL